MSLPESIYVDSTHGSQLLDLSLQYFIILITQPTSDSRAPLMSVLESHMSIKGLCALLRVSSYSLCLDISYLE